jgi:hypothetical protein
MNASLVSQARWWLAVREYRSAMLVRTITCRSSEVTAAGRSCQIPDGTAATPKTFGSCQTGNAMAEHSISRLAP